jgi:hypothetical protein
MRLPAHPSLRALTPRRAAPLAALLLAAGIALNPALVRAQSVTVRIDTPQIGIRIGQPLPRYAPPVLYAPAPVPPVVYVPAAVPPPVVVPVYPPVIYAPPRVFYAPVVVPPGRRWGHHHGWRHGERDERYTYRHDGRVVYAPF